jgi:hypothetical protein
MWWVAHGDIGVDDPASTNNTTTYQSACDTYTWSVNGTTYTQSGTYTSVSGCSYGDLGVDDHAEHEQHHHDQ